MHLDNREGKVRIPKFKRKTWALPSLKTWIGWPRLLLFPRTPFDICTMLNFKVDKNELQKGNSYVVCFEWKILILTHPQRFKLQFFLRKETVKKVNNPKKLQYLLVNIEHRTRFFMVLGNPIPSSVDPIGWLFFIWYIMLDLDCHLRCTSLPRYLAMLPSQATNTQRRWQWLATDLALQIQRIVVDCCKSTRVKIGTKNDMIWDPKPLPRFQWQVKIYRNPLPKMQ